MAKERIPFRAPRFAATAQMSFFTTTVQRSLLRHALCYDDLPGLTKTCYDGAETGLVPTGAPLYSDGTRNDVRHCSKPCAPSPQLPNLELRARTRIEGASSAPHSGLSIDQTRTLSRNALGQRRKISISGAAQETAIAPIDVPATAVGLRCWSFPADAAPRVVHRQILSTLAVSRTRVPVSSKYLR